MTKNDSPSDAALHSGRASTSSTIDVSVMTVSSIPTTAPTDELEVDDKPSLPGSLPGSVALLDTGRPKESTATTPLDFLSEWDVPDNDSESSLDSISNPSSSEEDEELLEHATRKMVAQIKTTAQHRRFVRRSSILFCNIQTMGNLFNPKNG